jgi:hypothetical protein
MCSNVAHACLHGFYLGIGSGGLVACIICPRQVDVHVLFKPGHYDLLYPGCFNVANPIGGFPCWDRFPKAPIGMGGIVFFFAREELNKHTCHSDWCFRMFQLSVCNVCRGSTVTGSEPYALESLCLNSSAGTSLLSIQGANLREYLKGVESFKLIR